MNKKIKRPTILLFSSISLLLSIVLAYIILDQILILKISMVLIFLILQIFIYQYHCTRTRKEHKSKLIAMMGLFMGLSVMFQCAPVFYPGVGLILSPFSSLPVSLACILFPQGAPAMVIGTTLLVSFISMEEAMIFALATGTVGIAVSMVILSRKAIIKTIWIPGLSLYTGILVLTYIVGIPGMKGFITEAGNVEIALIVLLFSIIYSGIWILIIKSFMKIIKKIMSIELS